MTTTYLLTSLQVPSPIGPGTFALGAGASGPFSTGMTAGVSAALNQLSAKALLLGQLGGGGYGVVEGLDLVPTSGLNLAATPGIALVDGLLELVASAPFGAQVQTPPATTLPDGAVSFVWLTQTGALATSVSLAPPTGARLFLGAATTAAGAIAGIDYSGRVSLVAGDFVRRTADPFAPADAPGPSVRVRTATQFGEYFWDGTSHKLLVDPGRQLPAPVLVEALTGALTLDARTPNVLWLSAASADQSVLLPAPADVPPGWSVVVVNVGTANDLILKDSAGSTLATLAPGMQAATGRVPAASAAAFPSSLSPVAALPLAP